jgi:PilZ domain
LKADQGAPRHPNTPLILTTSKRFLKPDGVGESSLIAANSVRKTGVHPRIESKGRPFPEYALEQLKLALTKKREARKSLQQSGWITLEGGFAARPCVVQDMSTTGARVTIDDPNVLPARLRLAFARDARTGRNCEVVWRRGKSVGVRFVR